MLSQVARWGNSQGVRIPKKLLQTVGINVNDSVEIVARDSELIIKSAGKKSLSWYLESYNDEPDRYDWGDSDDPKGQELL